MKYFTNDLFKAVFNEKNFAMSMILYDDYTNEDSYEKYTFKANLNEEIEFPSQLALVLVYQNGESDEKFLVTLDFLSKVTDITKQKEIEDNLVELGLI